MSAGNAIAQHVVPRNAAQAGSCQPQKPVGISLLREAVGHAGQIIAHRSRQRQRRRPAAESWPAADPVEPHSRRTSAAATCGRLRDAPALADGDRRAGARTASSSRFCSASSRARPAMQRPPVRTAAGAVDSPFGKSLAAVCRAGRPPANRSARAGPPAAARRSSRLGIPAAGPRLRPRATAELQQFVERQQAQLQRVVGVVRVVGDAVGRFDHLHFQAAAAACGVALSIRVACPSSTSRLRFSPGNSR